MTAAPARAGRERHMSVVALRPEGGVSEQVDGCLDYPDAGAAVLLAGLTRALVATALAEARRGTPPPAAPARWGDAALAAAARHGLAGAGVDPFTGRAADARPAVPPDRPRPGRTQGPRRRRAHHHPCAPARPPGYRGRPPAGPVRGRRVRARFRPRARPRHAIWRWAPAQRKIRAATGARSRPDRLKDPGGERAGLEEGPGCMGASPLVAGIVAGRPPNVRTSGSMYALCPGGGLE
jgi:hypothetical protein